jgi:AraC family transcriptional regulator of adaptative response/methylated-DNA-[protein]-cysteine methyltransferase
MSRSLFHHGHLESQTADVLIPIIRAAATVGFAIAPCSLGFVIIAVSEQIIRSIMVGDDPEMLVSKLQNQFPDAAIQATEHDEELVSQVVQLVDRSQGAPVLPFQLRDAQREMRV